MSGSSIYIYVVCVWGGGGGAGVCEGGRACVRAGGRVCASVPFVRGALLEEIVVVFVENNRSVITKTCISSASRHGCDTIPHI